MALLDDLEDELAARWGNDTLAVYADHLLSLGDPRGELIALDLHLATHPKTVALELKRQHQIRACFGIDPTDAKWRATRFTYGFVETHADMLDMLAGTKAMPYLRGLTIAGGVMQVDDGLTKLVRERRPWLSKLTLLFRPRPGRARTQPPTHVVGQALTAALIAATPRLDAVVLSGHRVLRALPHPNVRSMYVAGHDAIASLLAPGPAMPALIDLTYSFSAEWRGTVAFADGEGLPPTLLSADTLPALRRLDLSGNEGQRSWTENRVVVFELLPELGVLPQLTHLRVPSLRDTDEASWLQAALLRAPALVELDIVRDWIAGELTHPTATIKSSPAPWPPLDTTDDATFLDFAIRGEPPADGSRDGRPASMRRGIMMMTAFEDLTEHEQTAWTELWAFVEELPVLQPDIYGYGYDEPPLRSFPAETLLRALEALGDDIEDPQWLAVLDALVRARQRPLWVGSRVTIRRYQPY